MRIAILGATGTVGRLLVHQALERGHEVVALVRTPAQYEPPSATTEVRRADVTLPESFPALDDVDAVVSALGVRKADGPGALVAGARVLAGIRPRVIWLGALGSGSSAGAGGRIYQLVMKLFVGRELGEKARADALALAAGATVFHAPDLRDGGVDPAGRAVRLSDFPRPVLPPRISRATLAALLLDEVENPSHSSEILVPSAGA